MPITIKKQLKYRDITARTEHCNRLFWPIAAKQP